MPEADSVTIPGTQLRNAKHVADCISFYKDKDEQSGSPGKPPITFLIGAGFSVSAGVSTATKIVEERLRPHPLLASAGPTPPGSSDYAYLMSLLPASERIQIIRDCIDEARDEKTQRSKINWAHLLLAYLVEAGYVRTVLTTNFDPIMVDSLSLLGQPIRVFDITAARTYEPGGLEDGSVIYLHGQAHGLWLANVDEEMGDVRKHIRSVLQEVLSDTTLVVVGYSGDCDPVVEELEACRRQFSRHLFWVPYQSADKLGQNAKRIIADTGRGAYVVPGHDADSFMRALVLDELGLQLPKLLLKPRELMLDHLGRITKFPGRREEGPEESNPLETAKADLDQHIPPAEQAAKDLKAKVRLVGLSGKPKDFEALLPQVKQQQDKALQRELGDSGLDLAVRLDQEDELDQAISLLNKVVAIGSNDEPWVWTVLGNRLLGKAKTKVGDEADALYVASFEKYAKAVKLKPDMHEAFYNWGTALLHQAKSKAGDAADALYNESIKKFAKAVELKPNDHEAFNNWGTALLGQAKTKVGDKADALYAESCEKYAKAVKIKPDKYEAFCNWGTALSHQADTKVGEAADVLYAESFDKYAKALEIKPNDHEVFNNWGNGLLRQAKTKAGDEADALFASAKEKLIKAGELATSDPDPPFNLACLSALRGDPEQAVSHLKDWLVLNPADATRQKLIDEEDFDPIRQTTAFQAFLETLPK